MVRIFEEIVLNPSYRDNPTLFLDRAASLTDAFVFLDRTWASQQRVPTVMDLARITVTNRPLLLRQRARMLLTRLRRHARLVGRLRHALLALYEEVAYRPGHSGHQKAREEFHAAVVAW